MADWTQADIDALRAAIASGVLTVAFADRTVTYHSLTQLRALLAEMERAVSPTTSPAYRLAAFSKGI